MSKHIKTTSLGEILTDEQCSKVVAILDKNKGDERLATKSLVKFYRSINRQLAKKEIVPDWLAYMTMALHNQHKLRNGHGNN